jgi:hypothetical protein
VKATRIALLMFVLLGQGFVLITTIHGSRERREAFARNEASIKATNESLHQTFRTLCHVEKQMSGPGKACAELQQYYGDDGS